MIRHLSDSSMRLLLSQEEHFTTHLTMSPLPFETTLTKAWRFLVGACHVPLEPGNYEAGECECAWSLEPWQLYPSVKTIALRLTPIILAPHAAQALKSRFEEKNLSGKNIEVGKSVPRNLMTCLGAYLNILPRKPFAPKSGLGASPKQPRMQPGFKRYRGGQRNATGNDPRRAAWRENAHCCCLVGEASRILSHAETFHVRDSKLGVGVQRPKVNDALVAL
ncbi:hypothetical protein MAPG_00652 [Magnaporthiopsis poae ATCC 64411]|uniref:Uncharacterized protein n=1 Tax=Magnaporthiopsis poae (strain ATCC 64411 / 73-15) TaxID=644358 RepID=A0A0C4DLK8_MAGP6|nr:hypothetical protein MAPG_00652 [Magnaporthiopsis poae ATCC 64411]